MQQAETDEGPDDDDVAQSNSSTSSAAAVGFWTALLRLFPCAGRNRAPSSTAFLAPPPLPARRGLTVPAPVETLASQPPLPSMTKPVDCSEVVVVAEKAAGKADVRAEGLKAQLRDAAEAELWRRRAEVFRKAHEDCAAANADKDLEAIKLAEFADELLNPNASLQENEVLCCKLAEKIERTNARCGPLADEMLSEAARWRAAIAALAEVQDADARREMALQLHQELCIAGYIKEPRAKGEVSAAASLRRKYGKEVDCFLSPSGHEVVVGRSASANERVSHELALPSGFWFHADSGVAGSHVAILCPASEVHALEDVEFAAAVCAWHSKARSQSNAPVCYCCGGQIAKGSKLGQVYIRGQRGQLFVTPALPPSLS